MGAASCRHALVAGEDVLEEARALVTAAIALDWSDNGTAHDDLVLRLGDYEHRCDSYYFVSDPRLRPDEESASKTAAVLCALLEHWMARVEALSEGGETFLPYDFSDQCTAWLHVRRSGEKLTLEAGWSNLPGYAFSPSERGPEAPPDFSRIDSARPVELTQAELLRELRANRERLLAHVS